MKLKNKYISVDNLTRALYDKEMSLGVAERNIAMNTDLVESLKEDIKDITRELKILNKFLFDELEGGNND